jgi:DNA-binding response OmpR family regulator
MALRECLDGVDVRQIQDGEEAVEYFRGLTHRELTQPMCPDLVLLDLNLPRRNGFEVLAFMRSVKLLCAIPVVMFTSSPRTNDKKKAVSLGANEYITKPLSLSTMMALLDDVCARYLLKANGAAAGPSV